MVRRLLALADIVKRQLSALTTVEVDVGLLLGPDVDLVLSMSRCQFETICDDLFKRTIQTVKGVLAAAQVRPWWQPSRNIRSAQKYVPGCR